MPVFRFEEIDFYYECQGEGFPLLFLHGLGGDFSQCQQMLSDTCGFRKIFLDARAHGQTKPVGPVKKLSFDQFAKDALALMQHLKFDNAIVGGISMGSATALRLALNYPQMVKALLLVRPAWLNTPGPENLREFMVIGKLLAEHPHDQAKEIYCRRPEFKTLSQTAPAVATSALSQFDAPLAAERHHRLIRMPQSVPFASLQNLLAITQPALVIGTDTDPAHPWSIAQTISAHIPASVLAKVTSKTTDPQKHLRECSQAINSFLDQWKKSE